MESDPLVLKVKSQTECRLRRFFILSACVSILDERKSKGGSITCGKGGSIYSGFSKKCTVYGKFTLGLTIFVGLFLLDELVVQRFGSERIRPYGIDLIEEYHRLIKGPPDYRLLWLFNAIAFIPFGVFLAEFLSSLNSFGVGRRLWYVFGVAFCLSILIECLQLFFHVGFFEVTDLLANTFGAIIGALFPLIIRVICQFFIIDRDRDNTMVTL